MDAQDRRECQQGSSQGVASRGTTLRIHLESSLGSVISLKYAYMTETKKEM